MVVLMAKKNDFIKEEGAKKMILLKKVQKKILLKKMGLYILHSTNKRKNKVGG
jgi:hypothetical protein